MYVCMYVCMHVCMYVSICMYGCMYVCMYVCACMYVSLGALVPNSRDRHEKQWRPDFMHHKTHPKMHLV